MPDFSMSTFVQIITRSGHELSGEEAQQLDVLRKALERRGFRFGAR